MDNISPELQVEKKKRSRWKTCGIVLGIVGLVFIVVVAIGIWDASQGEFETSPNRGEMSSVSDADTRIPKPTRIPRPTNTPRPTRTPTPDVQALNAEKCQGSLDNVEYKDMFRYIEQYAGSFYGFIGEVVQVISGPGDLYAYRVDITRSEYGFWDDTIYVSTDRYTDLDTRILEEDVIAFCGQPTGIIKYETIFGATVEIPNVLMIKFNSLMECNDTSCFSVSD